MSLGTGIFMTTRTLMKRCSLVTVALISFLCFVLMLDFILMKLESSLDALLSRFGCSRQTAHLQALRSPSVCVGTSI